MPMMALLWGHFLNPKEKSQMPWWSGRGWGGFLPGTNIQEEFSGSPVGKTEAPGRGHHPRCPPRQTPGNCSQL